MKRSLIMLLVVALLSALLVPAMAEEAKVEPKLVSITLSSSDYKDFLYRGQVTGASSWPAADTNFIDVICQVQGDFVPAVIWSSSDEDIAEVVGGKTPQRCTQDKNPMPRLKAKKAGSIVITGEVYEDGDSETKYEKLATLTLNVTIELVKETSVEFTKKEYKLRVGNSVDVKTGNVTVKPDGEKGSTYSESDLQWSVSDSSIISVDKDGNVTAVNSDRTETVTAEVYATAKGDPTVKGTVKVTVYPKTEETEEAGLKAINFSTKEFELPAQRNDTYALNLSKYLTIEPEDNGYDLVWSSSNRNLAYVEERYIFDEVEDRYDWAYYVTTTSNTKPGDTVTITAASRQNPSVKNEVKLTFVEGKPIKKLAFSQESVKGKDGTAINLDSYLMVEYPDGYSNDTYIWTNSNPDAVTLEDGYVYCVLPETEATITVRSKMKPNDVYASIKVSFEKGQLEKIEFAKDLPKTVNLGTGFNVWDYVNTTPWYYTSNRFNGAIEWTSSDPRVASVDSGWLEAVGVGEATITATNKNNPAATASFTLTVKAIPVTAVTFNKDANYKMKVGKKIELGASDYISYTPADYSDVKLTWTSSDDEVATVDFDGCVTGKKAGTAEITVLVRNADGTTVEGKVTVTVVDADNKLTGFAFKKSEYKLEVGNNDDDYGINEHEIAISKMVKFTPADIDVTAYDWDKFDFYTSNDDIVKFVRVEDYSEPYFVFRTYKPGTVTLTAQSREDETLKAETTLVVEPIKVKKIARPTKYKKIEMPLYDVVPGSSEDNEDANTKSVHVNVTPSYAYYDAKWETSDASVAYVTYENNNKAVIRAVAPGTCKIKVTIDDGSKKYTRDMYVVVKAAKVTKLALNRSKVTGYIIKGAENTFQLTASDAKTGYEVPVKWTSSNAKVAKVYQNGLVKFLKAGTAKITATTKDGNKVSKSCTFTVKKLAVTEVVPASKSVTIKVGGEKTLKAKVKPAKAFNTALYFKSSDTKVVAVDQDGVVLGLKPGKATITISARDGSKKKATITVYVKAVAATNDGELEVLDGDLAIEGDLLENSFDIDVAGEDIVIADDEAVELSID